MGDLLAHTRAMQGSVTWLCFCFTTPVSRQIASRSGAAAWGWRHPVESCRPLTPHTVHRIESRRSEAARHRPGTKVSLDRPRACPQPSLNANKIPAAPCGKPGPDRAWKTRAKKTPQPQHQGRLKKALCGWKENALAYGSRALAPPQ